MSLFGVRKITILLGCARLAALALPCTSPAAADRAQQQVSRRTAEFEITLGQLQVVARSLQSSSLWGVAEPKPAFQYRGGDDSVHCR